MTPVLIAMTYLADEQGNLGETVTYQYSQDEDKTRAQVEGLVSDVGTTYISGRQTYEDTDPTVLPTATSTVETPAPIL